MLWGAEGITMVWNRISVGAQMPVGLIISVSLVALIVIVAGALLTYDPALYVRMYRRVAIGDYYAKSPEWAKRVKQPSSRILGVIFVAAGLFAIYKLLELLKLL
jgi:hypothetical protein